MSRWQEDLCSPWLTHLSRISLGLNMFPSVCIYRPSFTSPVLCHIVVCFNVMLFVPCVQRFSIFEDPCFLVLCFSSSFFLMKSLSCLFPCLSCIWALTTPTLTGRYYQSWTQWWGARSYRPFLGHCLQPLQFIGQVSRSGAGTPGDNPSVFPCWKSSRLYSAGYGCNTFLNCKPSVCSPGNTPVNEAWVCEPAACLSWPH